MTHTHGAFYIEDGRDLPPIVLSEDLRRATQRQDLDNEAALYARSLAACSRLRSIGDPGLVADFAAILVERSTVATVTLCETFGLSEARLMEMHDAEPIAIFSCSACRAPLTGPAARRTLLRRLRAQKRVARAEVGDPVPPEALYALMCGQCANDHQRRQDGQRQAERATRESRKAELRRMPFTDYLKTPEWRALRYRALSNARYRCALSDGCEGSVDVHHRSYARRGCELMEDLIVLCRVHHRLFHGILPEAA